MKDLPKYMKSLRIVGDIFNFIYNAIIIKLGIEEFIIQITKVKHILEHKHIHKRLLLIELIRQFIQHFVKMKVVLYQIFMVLIQLFTFTLWEIINLKTLNHNRYLTINLINL